MKWEEFIKDKQQHHLQDWALTSIECPKCGKLVYKYIMVTHVTFPPKNKYKCFGCGWEENA